jgi:hypothetical protein
VGLSLWGEEGRGECGYHAVAGFAPGRCGDWDEEKAMKKGKGPSAGTDYSKPQWQVSH